MSYSRLAQSHNEPLGTSSAVASVLFTRGGDGHQVTKSGSYIYWGDAGNFHEWVFRTELRARAAGVDPVKYAEVMSRIVDGLRGEAFIAAKDIGVEKLWQIGGEEEQEDWEEESEHTEFVQEAGEAETAEGEAAEEKGKGGKGKSKPKGKGYSGTTTPPVLTPVKPGVQVLIEAIRRQVFPMTTHEAKELFRQYCRPGGPLSRQNGESMQQYISRRRRCWNLLIELDPEMNLSEGHRADMLLDLAGLEKTERTMIQASIGNKRDFEMIAEALVVQHPRIHTKTTGGKGKSHPKFGKGGAPRPKGRGKGKGKKSSQWNPTGFAFHASEEAYMAMDDSCGYTADETYAHAHGDDDYPEDYAEAYNAYDEEEYDDSYPNYDTSGDWNDEGMEAYVAEQWENKWSVPDPVEACELDTVAYIVQTIGGQCTQDPELCSGIIQDNTALMAKGGKGKAKGKSGKYPIRPSNLALEDRRKMLADLKAKTPCKDCGRKGHWRGDKECTMRRNTSFERKGYVAVKFCESYSTAHSTSSSSAQFFEAGDSMEDADRCGYMVAEQDEEEPTNDDQEDLPNVFHWPGGFLERLPINAGQFWLPDTMEDLKYEQMTQLSRFLRRWRQYTTGNQMLRQMKKSKGEVALIPMDAATKKAVWRQGVQAMPDPMSLMLSLIHI